MTGKVSLHLSHSFLIIVVCGRRPKTWEITWVVLVNFILFRHNSSIELPQLCNQSVALPRVCLNWYSCEKIRWCCNCYKTTTRGRPCWRWSIPWPNCLACDGWWNCENASWPTPDIWATVISTDDTFKKTNTRENKLWDHRWGGIWTCEHTVWLFLSCSGYSLSKIIQREVWQFTKGWSCCENSMSFLIFKNVASFLGSTQHNRHVLMAQTLARNRSATKTTSTTTPTPSTTTTTKTVLQRISLTASLTHSPLSHVPAPPSLHSFAIKLQQKLQQGGASANLWDDARCKSSLHSALLPSFAFLSLSLSLISTCPSFLLTCLSATLHSSILLLLFLPFVSWYLPSIKPFILLAPVLLCQRLQNNLYLSLYLPFSFVCASSRFFSFDWLSV